MIYELIFSYVQKHTPKFFTFATYGSLRTHKQNCKSAQKHFYDNTQLWLILLFIKDMMDQGLQRNVCFLQIIIYIIQDSSFDKCKFYYAGSEASNPIFCPTYAYLVLQIWSIFPALLEGIVFPSLRII